MTNSNTYERLSNQGTGSDDLAAMPNMPPAYEELHGSNSLIEDIQSNEGNALNINDIEQFEIDDLDYDIGPSKPGFLKRASSLTKKLAVGFSNSVIEPVTKIIDPIYEGLLFLNLQYERSILKIGNPLVVKRLLYVAFMVGVVFLINHYSINEGVNGASGGAFSSGKFYDISKLAGMIDDLIDPKVMKENLEYLSSMPHIAGTEGDLTLSKYVETYMKNNGIQNIDYIKLQSYINYPSDKKAHTLLLLSDGSFEATLNEMGKKDMEYYGYNPNALNTDSELEGHYIYGNYGSQSDFDALSNANVDLKGSILLLKYGGSIPEANKIEIAETKEVKAIVFISKKYSIGSDDNKKDITEVIQRENVGNSRYSTGDVLTPGWSSEDGYSSRLLWFKSKTTPKIPTIPISYKDGHELISRLGEKGHQFKQNLYSGEKSDDPSKKLKLRIGNEQKQTHPIWNVVGSIPGREQHDKSIIIGATRDSACFGTISSNTGTVILLELIKIFTSIQRKFNWSPSRTITFVSFDASNYNLAGLTEWIEEKKNYLKNQAYSYIDLSDAVSGNTLSIKANPFLHDVISECLKEVGSSTIQTRDRLSKQKLQHKEKSMNLYELFKAQNNGQPRISNNLLELKNYVPFVNFLNVPSMEIKFKGYDYPKHSCYDNFENFEAANIDPKMQKHVQLTQIISRAVLRLAEEPIIPFKFKDFVSKLYEYEGDLEKYINNAIKADTRPGKPTMHYDHLLKSLNTLQDAASQFDNWVDSWKHFIVNSAEVEQSLLAMKRWKWNSCLVEFNQQFISTDVQHSRPGYLNLLFGIPYDAPPVDDNNWQWNTFPAVRDYIAKGDFGRAQYEIDRLAGIIEVASVQFTSY